MKYHIGVGELKITKEDKKLVNQVLDSNRLSYGKFSRSFEQQLAKLHGLKYAIFVNSGTNALQIALAAMKEYYHWKDGDEVILPSTTFVATANIILYNNMKPVFVDVDYDTFNINPEAIEVKITQRTRAIIPVHLLGLPCDMDKIIRIAKKHNLHIIEDSCETMFANGIGQGEIMCLSTYTAHYITTGVGGLAITSNPKLAIIMRSLANHGRDSIYISIDDGKRFSKEIIAKRFNFVRNGFSARATELEAAIGVSQLKRRRFIIKRRLEVAKTYSKGLADLSEYLALQESKNNVYMLFGILLKKGNKKKLVNYLELNGIETRDLLPLVTQKIYKKYFKNREKDYPVSTSLAKQAFYIGCHQYLTDDDVDYVISKFHEFFKQ